MYLNSVTIVGFVGADPEQRQVKSNGAKFTVLSVATPRSWKNAEDEWASKTEWHRVPIFRPRLAEYVLANVKKGAHVLIEGSLASSTYVPANGKGKKPIRRNSRRGRFAPRTCASSIAKSPSRRLPPRKRLRHHRVNRVRLPSRSPSIQKSPAPAGAFFVLALTPTRPNEFSRFM